MFFMSLLWIVIRAPGVKSRSRSIGALAESTFESASPPLMARSTERGSTPDAHGQQQAFRHGFEMGRDEQLVDQLGRLTRATAPHQHGALAKDIEERLRLRKGFGRSPDHDDELTRHGPGLSAADGGVEAGRAARGESRGDGPGSFRRHAAHVDEHRVVVRNGKDAVRPVDDVFERGSAR